MIKRAGREDACLAAELACKLWPEHTLTEMEAEFVGSLAQEDTVVFFYNVDRQTVGFAQCGLRHDYVEGTETSPVGYLEGIYIEESFRRKGYARELLSACRQWAREMGCREFASDCELSNIQSLQFHLHCGFEEANRIVCFTQTLC